MVVDHGAENVKGVKEMDILPTTTGRTAINENPMRFYKDGIEYLDIHEYAYMAHITVAAVRAAIEQGNRVRKLKAIRNGLRYYIPLSEYYIYPYINKGKGKDVVKHFTKEGELVICEACTEGTRCIKIDNKGEWNGK